MRRPGGTATLLMLVGLSMATAGCRTFNYTDEDMEEERKLLAERAGLKGGWVGWGVGGGVSPRIGNLNLGSINCPNAGSGVCPGK